MKNIKRKALVIWGGWDGHTPKECAKKYHDFLEKNNFEVTISTDQNIYTDKDFMAALDLIVPIVTMSEINLGQVNGLLDAVRNGVGIAGHHGGMSDSYRNNTEYQFMVGGQWVAHPGNIINYEVNILDHKDPITYGLSDFKVRSEQYYMHVDPANEVLAETTFSGKNVYWIDGFTMPVVWKKKYGKGNVVYTSLGHTVDVFDIPEALTIVKRGILWAMRELN